MKDLKHIQGLGFLILLGLFGCQGANGAAFSQEQLRAALTELSAERTLAAAAVSATPTQRVEVPSPSPSASASAQISPDDSHYDGIYIVGAEIAPGLWRSTAEDSGLCYWARRKYDGIVLKSYYGLPGVEMRIFDYDYEVELVGCGVWEFIGR